MADRAEPLRVDAQHPWPGLVAFDQGARPFFFGRDREEYDLLREIHREIATLLFGQSGLGKTSLLQAGLAARLRDDGLLPVLVRLSFDPDAKPPLAQLRSLVAEAMAAAAPDEPSIGEDETLWEYFHRCAPAAPSGAARPVPVLLIDQFEEVFTLGLARAESRAATQQFLAELTDLIENRVPPAIRERLERDSDLIGRYDFERSDYRIVIAIREDYLAELESLRAHAPSLGQTTLRLARMDGLQALEAVVRPGRDLIEPEVAEEIVRHVADKRREDPLGPADAESRPELADLKVSPPLLSLFCSELNARRLKAGQDQITSDLLDLNKDRIISDFYEAGFKGLPARLRRFVEDELVTDSGVRDNMAVEQAEKKVGRGGREALEELVRRRLLQREERFEVPRIELIHDLLVPVVLDSRKRRRKRKIRLALGLGLVLIVALIAALGYQWWDATENERARARLKQRADACSVSPRSQTCQRLINADERTLRSLPATEIDPVLVGLWQASNSRFASGDVAGSLDFLRKADILLQGRPEYELARASNFSSMAQRERWLGRRATALEHSRLARTGLLDVLSRIRELGEETEGSALLDDYLSQVAFVDYQLALLDPAGRDAYLDHALELENERVQRAEQSQRAAPTEGANARRQLIFALGSRSWAHVLLNRPADALDDVARAEQLAGAGGLLNDPEITWILTNRGDALVLLGQVDAAFRVFDQIQAKPGVAPNQLMCGDVLEDMRWLREMHRRYLAAIERVEQRYRTCIGAVRPNR